MKEISQRNITNDGYTGYNYIYDLVEHSSGFNYQGAWNTVKNSRVGFYVSITPHYNRCYSYYMMNNDNTINKIYKHKTKYKTKYNLFYEL